MTRIELKILCNFKRFIRKIQLTGTTKYPENVNNPSKGRDQAHDVTLQLYDSARKFNDALWNDPKVPSKPAKPAKATFYNTKKPANQTTASTQSSVES